jgi:hypothetical protein
MTGPRPLTAPPGGMRPRPVLAARQAMHYNGRLAGDGKR